MNEDKQLNRRRLLFIIIKYTSLASPLYLIPFLIKMITDNLNYINITHQVWMAIALTFLYAFVVKVYWEEIK